VLVTCISLAVGKNPRESVKSVSSVVYELGKSRLLVTHRPRMTLIRRISTDLKDMRVTGD
jgi:hypothetical protein